MENRKSRLRRIPPLLFFAATAYGQTSQPSKLAFVLPDILEQAIQKEPDLAVQAYLRQSITGNWVSINASVAAQLSNLPNPSAASAYRYTFDRTSGTFQRTLQSLGPVLTERVETIGKDKFYFGVTFQEFNFDRLDDLDLNGFRVGAQFTLPTRPFPTEALLTANASISVRVSQVTAHLTYGVTHWLDISYAFPIVSSSLSARGSATLVSIRDPIPPFIDLQNVDSSASSAGLGDGIVRLKSKIWSRRNAGIAFGTDVRLPIGDELNYHGAGAYGVKPFLIASLTTNKISPHLNAGYQFNGKSFLASEFANQKRRLPGQIFYAVGFDAGISPRMTMAVDFLDQIVISGQRTFLRPLGLSGESPPGIFFDDRTRHEYNASVGFKARLREDLLFTGNVTMRLNNAGLRARVVPLVGLSYLF